MAEGYSGPFDYFQDFAFYVPYLIAVEFYIRAKRRGPIKLHPAVAPTAAITAVAAMYMGRFLAS
jgi:uncharacterized membrane protein